jgi:hypothetical protein
MKVSKRHIHRTGRPIRERCPSCKKLRKKNEPQGGDGNPPKIPWQVLHGRAVCGYCVKRDPSGAALAAAYAAFEDRLLRENVVYEVADRDEDGQLVGGNPGYKITLHNGIKITILLGVKHNEKGFPVFSYVTDFRYEATPGEMGGLIEDLAKHPNIF